MKSFKISAFAVALSLVASLASADHWLHVKVNEGDGDTKVTVNLPLNLIEGVLAMIPEEEFRDGRIVLEDTDFSIAELRTLWNEMRDSPDMKYVTVESDDENVTVWKEGDYLLVKVREDEGEEWGEQVDVRMPLPVIDALLSSQDDELDLAGALRALAEFGEGDLVTVNSRNESVRVWIDQIAEAD